MRYGLPPSERDHRPAFAHLKPFGGGQWRALTRACCEAVLSEVAARPGLVRFVRGMAFADETLIHTMVGNSRFASHTPRALTFTRWRPGGSSPDVLNAVDMHHLLLNPEHPEDGVYEAAGTAETEAS